MMIILKTMIIVMNNNCIDQARCLHREGRHQQEPAVVDYPAHADPLSQEEHTDSEVRRDILMVGWMEGGMIYALKIVGRMTEKID